MTRLAVNLVLALSVTALGMGGIETWFRHREGWLRPLYALDDELGWVHRPNQRVPYPIAGTTVLIETDAQGFRPPFQPPPSDKPRVLVLGDSFVDALEIATADHFAVRLQERRPELELYNAGVIAYSTVQELLMAQRLESQLRPVARVLFVYENDVIDNVSPYYPLLAPRPWVDVDGRRRPVEWDPFIASLLPVPFAAWLHRHSATFFRIETLWVLRWRPEHLVGADALAKRRSPEERWAVFRDVVAELRAMGPLLLVACPSKDELSHGSQTTSTRVAAVGASLGVPVLDLGDALAPEHYWERNIHWNAAGHRVVADALGPALDALMATVPAVASE